MNTTTHSGRRPYRRSMQGWWRRNPYYMEYMLHEATALFVAAYALVLLVGLVRLSQGEAAWNEWLTALRSPWWITFHVLALAAIGYHAWTWFQIMPRTLPPILIRGRRLSAMVITRGGISVLVLVSLLLWVLVWSLWT